MELLSIKPEKEPLFFEFNNSNVDESIAEARNSIKKLICYRIYESGIFGKLVVWLHKIFDGEVKFYFDNREEWSKEGSEDLIYSNAKAAENLLYHWKSLPIVLPPSITDETSEDGDRHFISFKDLFVAPTFDELDQVAKDPKGNIKKLNRKQLMSIRNMGEFEVDSLNFPGQTHKWRLNLLLQKGLFRTHESFLDDLALALKMLIIYSKNRFNSPFFSLSQSYRNLKKSFHQFLDIMLGIPSTKPDRLTEKLIEEHSKFLVAELIIKSESKQDWKDYCSFIKSRINAMQANKMVLSTMDLEPPPHPYKFSSPNKTEIDLRLFNKNLMSRSYEVLTNILKQESKGWYIKYKDKIITDLKDRNMSYFEIKEHVCQCIQEKYYEKVFQAILCNAELEAIQPGLGLLLVNQAKCALNTNKNLTALKEKFEVCKAEYKANLTKEYPVRSRINEWLNKQLSIFWNQFMNRHVWDAHLQTLEVCKQQQLHQMTYFLTRDLMFMKDREPILRRELRKIRVANRHFTFSRIIWFPENWIIIQHIRNESVKIPTVVNSSPLRSNFSGGGENQPMHTVDKTITHKTSTKYPFWRMSNFLHRSYVWMFNAILFFGIMIPWCSPVSLRALCGPHSFMPYYVLNTSNGQLYPDPSTKRNTLASRLLKLCNHIRRSREQFENETSVDFLGKSLTRHINRFWNYVLKGFFGGLLMILIMIPICLLCSVTSLILAVLAPIWVPAGVILLHIFAVAVYDFDHPDDTNRWLYIFEMFIYRFIICSCLQPVCAFVLAIVIFPLIAFIICIGGTLRRTCRVVWDCLMYHLIIKKRGRVPTHDAFIVRRIAGPGLASRYYLQVRPEQALAAVEACMESHELNVWMECYTEVINQPKLDYKKFVETCFKPFSSALVEDGVYHNLVLESNAYLNQLRLMLDGRKQKLNTGLTADLKSKIRLTSRELKVVIAQSSRMLETFYPTRIFRRMHKSEVRFWEDKNLDYRDWQGLATQLLTEVFSSSFLCPLEEVDTCFKLNVDHLNLSKYMEMLKSSEFRDDLDVVSALHTPKGDIDVSPPFMNIHLFSPISDTSIHVTLEKWQEHKKSKCPWQQDNDALLLQHVEKLSQPLPIAHPCLICLVIHNRDESRYTIDTNNIICQKILHHSEQNQPYVNPSLMSTSTTTENESCEASSIIFQQQQQQQMLMQHNSSTLQLKQQHSPTSFNEISSLHSEQQQQHLPVSSAKVTSKPLQQQQQQQQHAHSMKPMYLAKQESITSDITLSERRSSAIEGPSNATAPLPFSLNLGSIVQQNHNNKNNLASSSSTQSSAMVVDLLNYDCDEDYSSNTLSKQYSLSSKVIHMKKSIDDDDDDEDGERGYRESLIYSLNNNTHDDDDDNESDDDDTTQCSMINQKYIDYFQPGTL